MPAIPTGPRDCGAAQAAPAPQPEGDVVVTKNDRGQIVAVTRQDGEGRILSVIAESVPQPKAAVVNKSLTTERPEAKCATCSGHGWVIVGLGESAGADPCPTCVEGEAAEPVKPLDDTRLQELFSATIDGALTAGFQGVAPAPAGHWLEFWWQKGRAVAEAAEPVPSPVRPQPVAWDAIIDDIESLALWYQGSPRYEHGGDIIRQRAADVVRRHAALYATPPAAHAVDAAQQSVERDALRYRWLRVQDWFDSELCVLRSPKTTLTRGAGLGADCPSRERLDAAIDSANASSTGAGNE